MSLEDARLDFLSILEFLKTPYIKTGFLMFASSTETNEIQTSSHITNDIDGYAIELEKCGQASTDVPVSKLLQTNPYPNRLRPITDFSFLNNAKRILIKNIRFYAYDSIKIGSSFQDVAVNTDIDNSQSSSINAYASSHYLNTLNVDWQPNYFRPEVYIRGTNIFAGFNDNYFKDRNKGDLSIGEHLPFEEELTYFIDYPISKNDIEVYATCGQYIPSQSKVVRYPIMSRIKVLYV